MARIPLVPADLNLGSAPGDGTGSKLRSGGQVIRDWMDDINEMTQELYEYPVVHHAAGFTLTSGDVSTVHTNRTGSNMQVWQLPAGAEGLWFIAQRVANYEIRLEPNGSQIIGEGGAGKYLSIQSRGRVVIEWMTDQWEVVSDSATYNFEP
jgi:hypothetical protein